MCTPRARRPFFPATLAELSTAGWTDTKRSKWCECGVCMFWFTTPNGKFCPMELMEGGKWTPHHSRCKLVKQFRKADRNYRDRVDETLRPRPVQGNLFAGDK